MIKVSLSDCILFDDQLVNLVPLKEYGIKSIWIESEKSIEKKEREKYPNFEPDFQLKSFDGLLDIVGELNG